MIKKFKLLFSLQQISKIFPRLYPKTSKSSQFGKALCESNKIKKFYGRPSLKYLKKLFQKKQYFPFQKQETFFRFLESRLDVVLYRSGFFETLSIAKQQIHFGFIKVNKKIVFSPKYILQPGDIINLVSTGRGDEELNVLLSKSKVKKKVVWRFKRSPFFLSLININKGLISSVEKLKTLKKNKRTIELDNLSQSCYNDTASQKKKRHLSGNFSETDATPSVKPVKLIYKRFISFSLVKNLLNSLSQGFFNETVLKQVFLTNNQMQNLMEFYKNKFFQQEQKCWHFGEASNTSFEFIKNAPFENTYGNIFGTPEKLTFNSAKRFKNSIMGCREETKNICFSHPENQLKAVPLATPKVCIFRPTKKSDSKTMSLFFKKIRNKQNGNQVISKQPGFFSLQRVPILNLNKDVKAKFQNNWLFSIYNLFLKKKSLFSQNSSFRQKSLSYPPKNMSVQISSLQHTSFNVISDEKKAKKFNFFKDQPFFVSKKIKPLHLEISYRSRSIIFLFPPQRICLPSYINLLEIYK